MKQLTRYSLPLIFVLSCFTISIAQGTQSSSGNEPPAPAIEYNPGSWKSLLSLDGGFSVLLPGKPTRTTQQIESPSGQITQYTYLLSTGVGTYRIAYFDSTVNRNNSKGIKSALDAERDSLLAVDKQRKLLSEREVKVAGYTGREWLIEDGDTIIRSRSFISHRRAYQIGLSVSRNVAFKTGKPSADPADLTDFYNSTAAKFFDSFKLLNGGSTTSRLVQ